MLANKVYERIKMDYDINLQRYKNEAICFKNSIKTGDLLEIKCSLNRLSTLKHTLDYISNLMECSFPEHEVTTQNLEIMIKEKFT